MIREEKEEKLKWARHTAVEGSRGSPRHKQAEGFLACTPRLVVLISTLHGNAQKMGFPSSKKTPSKVPISTFADMVGPR